MKLLATRRRSRFAALASVLVLALMAGCSGVQQQPEVQAELDTRPLESDSVERVLQLAEEARFPEAEGYLLQAVALLLDANALNEAESLLTEIARPAALPDEMRAEYALAQAQLALGRTDAAEALRWLGGTLIEPASSLPASLQVQVHQLRSAAHAQQDEFLDAARERVRLGGLLDEEDRQENNSEIWYLVSNITAATLEQSGDAANSYEFRGWLELATAMTGNRISIDQQLAALERWRSKWNQHSAAVRLPEPLAYLYELAEQRISRVALLLPMDEQIGKALSEGFFSAHYRSLELGNEVPQVSVYNTSGIESLMPIYNRAVADGAEFIIGPLVKDRVRELQRRRSLEVPTLALNYAETGERSAGNLYQFGLAPEDEIVQAADMAWHAGHRNSAVVTPAGGDYIRLQNAFADYWHTLGGRVLGREGFTGANDYADTVKRLLHVDASEARAARLTELLPRSSLEFIPRRRQDLDFVFLIANPTEGRQIKPTLGFYFAGELPVYSMPGIYDGDNNPTNNRDLNGVTFTDAPWVLEDSDPLKGHMEQHWPQVRGPLQRLRAMGVDSYHLYSRLPQLESYPSTTIPGATGLLSMEEDRTVTRRLAPARFVDGTAILLN